MPTESLERSKLNRRRTTVARTALIFSALTGSVLAVAAIAGGGVLVPTAQAASHAAPTPPTVTSTTSTSATVTWPTYAGTGRYYITWSAPGVAAASVRIASGTTTTTLTGLKPSTAYVVSVNAGVDGQWSVESNNVSFQTAADPAAANPLTLNPPTVTTNSATVSWLNTVAGATSYTVTASLDAQLAAGVSTLSQTVTTKAPVTFNILAYGKTYYFRVAATVGAQTTLGPVISAALLTGVDSTKPAPTIYKPGVDAQAFQPVKGQAGFTWTSANVGAVDYYRVTKWAVTPAGLDTLLNTMTVKGNGVYQESGLPAGTWVRFRVQNCWGAGGCGVLSSDILSVVK